MKTAKLTITDDRNLQQKANEIWMEREKCEGWLLCVVFGKEELETQCVVFGPFDGDCGVKQRGMQAWDEKSKEAWSGINIGASLTNPIVHDVWFGYIPLQPEE